MKLLVLFIFFTVVFKSDAPDYREVLYIERQDVGLKSVSAEHFAFNPDGTRIAAADASAVNIWDIETGEVIRSLDHAATFVSWSPDGEWITSGDYSDRALHVWEAETGILRYVLDGYWGAHVTWSPDSRQFVTNGMRIVDVETGDIVLQLDSNWGIPHEAHWSPDGTMIVTTSGWEGDFINLWSVSGERLDTYWGDISAAWSPDSTRLASLWQVREIATGLPIMVIPQMDTSIAWHPTGEWISSVEHEGGVIALWDAETGELVTSWQREGCAVVRGFAWSADGERFAFNCIQYEPTYQNDLVIWERKQ
jgi:WD40 repeat protein